MARLIIQYQTTPDCPVGRYDDQGTCVGWGWIPEPPPGDGWVISDASGEYDTRWRRIVLTEEFSDEQEDAR